MSDALQKLMHQDERSYIRPGLVGGLGTPVLAALLQMFDYRGLTPDQINRNSAMRGPLYKRGLESLIGVPTRDAGPPVNRDSIAEDANSVMLKYNNWRKQNAGIELSPQERITQGFLDVRNPNSRF